MATFKQTLVEPDDTATATGGKGKRNDANIRASFPGSPIYLEVITDDVVLAQAKTALQGELLDSIVTDADANLDPGVTQGVVDTSGYYTEDINLNYYDATNVSTKTQTADGKEFGKGNGAPQSPYVPGLASPGIAGKTEPSDQPEYSGTTPTATKQWGQGDGHEYDPYASSADTSKQTIGSYLKGTKTPNPSS